MEDINRKYKFTDELYLSRKEIHKIVQNDIEVTWKQVCEYRNLYRFPLPIVSFRGIPFTIVLTPSIMAKVNTCERKMFEYSRLFEMHHNRALSTSNKVFERYKLDCLKQDLLITAYNNEIVEFNDANLEKFLNSDSIDAYPDSLIKSLYKVNELLTSNSLEVGFNKQSILKVSSLLNKVESYRSDNLYKTIDNEEYLVGCQNYKISEFMEHNYNFYSGNYELSPFIIASIIYFYNIYIQPFEKYNGIISTLMLEKVIADSLFKEVAYYSNFLNSFTQNNLKIKLAISNAIADNGDVTYVICTIVDALTKQLDEKIKQISTLVLPDLLEFKQTEIIKEVIKEVPVIKEVEKIVYVDKNANKKMVEDDFLKPRQESIQFDFEVDPFSVVDKEDEE